MKTFKMIIGIIITVASSVYLMFSLSILSMANSYGTKSPFIILGLPVAFLVLGIYLIVAANKEESNELKRYKQQEQQQREIYYRNRDYKAKDSRFYLMTPKEKLEYTYESLPERERQKVLDYAESLLRQIENQKYEPKK